MLQYNKCFFSLRALFKVHQALPVEDENCDNDVKVEDTVKSKIKMTKAGENTSIIYIF